MIRVLLNGNIFTENLLTWADRNEVITRSHTFHGVIIEESLELQFIQEAFDFIKDLDDDYDVAAECTISIQSYDNIEGWEDDFTGYLNFNTIKYDTSDTKKITISAYSNNFANKILERLEIEVPYDRLETLDGETITAFTNEYETVKNAVSGLSKYFHFYNKERPHQALGYKTPDEVYQNSRNNLNFINPQDGLHAKNVHLKNTSILS